MGARFPGNGCGMTVGQVSLEFCGSLTCFGLCIAIHCEGMVCSVCIHRVHSCRDVNDRAPCRCIFYQEFEEHEKNCNRLLLPILQKEASDVHRD
jgi:hypothetical protein